MKRLGLILLGIYLIVFTGISTFQQIFIFQPKSMRPEKAFQFEDSFEEYYLKHEEKDLLINGLCFQAEGPSKGVILYFHGNRGNLQRWGKYADDFTQHGYDFFAIDYPGYGKSTGKPSEKNLYRSAELAYQWATQKYDTNEIIIYGRSLGSAPATYLASKFPAEKLILETPFYSFRDLFNKHMVLALFPIPPKYTFPVNEYFLQTNIEKAVFHGTRDKVVPLASAIRLKNLMRKKQNFFIIERGKHNNLNKFRGYHRHLARLLEDD